MAETHIDTHGWNKPSTLQPLAATTSLGPLIVCTTDYTIVDIIVSFQCTNFVETKQFHSIKVMRLVIGPSKVLALTLGVAGRT